MADITYTGYFRFSAVDSYGCNETKRILIIFFLDQTKKCKFVNCFTCFLLFVFNLKEVINKKQTGFISFAIQTIQPEFGRKFF